MIQERILRALFHQTYSIIGLGFAIWSLVRFGNALRAWYSVRSGVKVRIGLVFETGRGAIKAG